MVSVNGPGPDSEVAVEALRRITKETVSLVAVYGATAFDLFHIDETIREDFRSRSELVAYLSPLAEETRCEFMEHGLFPELGPVQNSVEYRFEERNGCDVLQVYCDNHGILLSVDPDESIEPLMKTASQLLGGA